MSLESLNALKTLVEQRSQGASVQNDNLENVQKQVQQTGTGEAQRVDKLNLEVVKADYETKLIKAKVDHLNAKLEREAKAVALGGLILGVTAALSAASNIYNLASDLGGKSKLGDSSAGNGGSLNGAASGGFDKSTIEKKGTAGDIQYSSAKDKTEHKYDKDILKQDGVIDKDGKIDVAKAKEKGFIGKDGEENAGKITAAGEKFGFQEDGKGGFSIKEGEKSQVVARTETNGDGSIQNISVSSIRQSDINKALQEKGFLKDGKLTEDATKAGLTQDASGISFNGKKLDNFQNLVEFEKSGKAAGISDKAFSYNERSIQDKAEVDTYLSITDKADASGKTTEAAKDHLKTSGKYESGWDKFKGGVNATTNAVVSFAQDVAPFFEAYQKAKDKRDETAIELDAEVQKLAAAFKRLKALQIAIVNPGVEGEGSAAGQGSEAN